MDGSFGIDMGNLPVGSIHRTNNSRLHEPRGVNPDGLHQCLQTPAPPTGPSISH